VKIALMVHRFHPEIGGVEVTAEVLARGFAQSYGDDVTVITHTTAVDPSVTFPFRVLRAPSRRALVEAIKDADVVFHNNPCMQVYWPQLLIRRPWVVAVRMWITLPGQVFTGADRVKYALKTRMVESADVLVANSQAVAGHLRGVERVAVAGHGGLLEAIGDAGPTFAPSDPVATADVIERLMTDDDSYEGFRARAVVHVSAHCESVMVDGYRAVLAEAVSARESTRGWRGTIRQLRRFLNPG
jgi:hypothetical protein